MRHARRDQVGDPVGQHARLARARAGEDEQRPSPCVTASRCGGLRSASRRSVGSAPARVGAPDGLVRGCSSSLGASSAATGSSIATRAAAAAPKRLRRRSPDAQPPAEDGPRRGRSSRTSGCGGSSPDELGDLALELGDPLRHALDRLGDRVGKMDPVGVGALDLAALDPHGMAGVADHGRVRRDVLDHDRVGADLGAVADRDRAEQLGAGADRDVVLDVGWRLPRAKPVPPSVTPW